jgi:hypothetical protein
MQDLAQSDDLQGLVRQNDLRIVPTLAGSPRDVMDSGGAGAYAAFAENKAAFISSSQVSFETSAFAALNARKALRDREPQTWSARSAR